MDLQPTSESESNVVPTTNDGLQLAEMGEWDVILLDDGGVGKTALIIQLTLNCWLETYDPTMEHGFRKQLLVDNRVCFLKVIDTGGQEEFSSLRDHWIRESQGSILVYSIASRSTFDRLQIFRQAFRSNQRRGEPIMVLVGNKSDKSHEREVTFEEGAALAQDFGCEFLETSAKTAENVDLAREGGGRDDGDNGGHL